MLRKKNRHFTFAEKDLGFPAGFNWDVEKNAEEFDYLKRRTAKLYRLNRLHRKLAGTLHLNGLIEEFSRWLEPYLPHLLFGYCQDGETCHHLCCHAHGDERRRVMALMCNIAGKRAEGLLCRNGDYMQYQWGVEAKEGAGFLFLLCHKILNEKEFELINNALEVMVENLPRGLKYEKVHFQATRDTLTGLANRRIFEEQSRELMTSALLYNHPLSLLLIDLDNFKAVNDNLGHLCGDEVLVKIAQILRDTVRTTDVVARIGGDEFAVLLDNTGLSGAKILADRLCKAVDRLAIEPVKSLRLGLSIGLSCYKEREDLTSWMQRTDTLLYCAKKKGKGKYCWI